MRCVGMEGRALLESTACSRTMLHDVEVCGELHCQFGGVEDFVPVYVELGAGALSICADRAGGALISTARVPDLSRLLIRTPRTRRAGRPHCLRVDLPDDEPDSRGMCKYIFDLGTVENLDKWRRGLSARNSEVRDDQVEAGSWWKDLKLNLNLDQDDELRRGVSLDLSPKARAMITHHKKAQLEVVHNSIVEAKRRAGVAAQSFVDSVGSERSAGSRQSYDINEDWVCVDDESAYENWLQRSMPQDYDNEFVACSRKNEALHELWDSTQASDGLSHVYTEVATNHIDQLRVERMVKIEFSPLHELIQDADNLQAEGRTSEAEEMYGWLIDRLMDQLEAEPDPNKKLPLASKIRIIQGRMSSKGLSSDPQGKLFRVTSNGDPTTSAPTAALAEGMAVEFLATTGSWRSGQVHGVENGIVTIMHTTDGIVGFKEVDSADVGAIRMPQEPKPESEPEPEPAPVAEGLPPGSGSGLLRLTPQSRWQPDEDCERCSAAGCQAPEFTFSRRRHHCRGCGLVFCDRCSPKTPIVSAGLCPKSGVVGLEFGKVAPTVVVSLVAGKLIFRGSANSDGVERELPGENTEITREFDVRGCTVERVPGRERTLRIVGASGATGTRRGGTASKVGNFMSRKGPLNDADRIERYMPLAIIVPSSACTRTWTIAPLPGINSVRMWCEWDKWM